MHLRYDDPKINLYHIFWRGTFMKNFYS